MKPRKQGHDERARDLLTPFVFSVSGDPRYACSRARQWPSTPSARHNDTQRTCGLIPGAQRFRVFARASKQKTGWSGALLFPPLNCFKPAGKQYRAPARSRAASTRRFFPQFSHRSFPSASLPSPFFFFFFSSPGFFAPYIFFSVVFRCSPPSVPSRSQRNGCLFVISTVTRGESRGYRWNVSQSIPIPRNQPRFRAGAFARGSCFRARPYYSATGNPSTRRFNSSSGNDEPAPC